MGQFEDFAGEREQARMLIREMVATGNGAEALRLANKYNIPNIERIDLGVKSDPAHDQEPQFEARV